MKSKKSLDYGLSGKKIFLNKKIIYKENITKFNNINPIILNNYSYLFAPLYHYFLNTKNPNYYSYKYIKGKTIPRPKTISFMNIKIAVKAINQLQKINTNNNDNLVLVHSDFTPNNVVFIF